MSEKIITLSNKNPLKLDGSHILYKVLTGNVYLFSVEDFPDGTHGARFPISVLPAGSIFFDLPPSNAISFIITGSEDTQITAEPLTAFSEPAEEKKLADLFQRIGESSFFNRENRNISAVSSDPEKIYEDHKELLSHDLVWITASSECYSFCNDPVSEWTQNARFPLCGHHSVFLTAAGKIQYVTTGELLADGTLKNNLSLYIHALVKKLCDIKVHVQEKEKEQSINHQYYSDLSYSTSLRQIGSIVNHDSMDDYDVITDSLLVHAARFIGKKMSMQITGLPGKQYEISENGIQELARDNNIRIRRVVLKDGWWNQDNGMLLVFVHTDSQKLVPAALMTKQSGKYLLVNAETNTSQILTEKLAETVETQAFLLYKPLPDGAITKKTLLLFCLPNIRSDMLWYIVLGIIITLVGLLTPEMTRIFMDTLIPQAAKNQLLQISFLVFMCTLSSMAFGIVRSIAMLRMETKADSTLQAAVLDRLLKLPVPFFSKFTSGDLSERAMALTAIRSILSGSVISGFMTFVFSLIYLAQLFRFSSYLIKWGLLFCLIPIVLSVIIDLFNYQWTTKLTNIQGEITGIMLQFLTGITKLITSSSEKRAFGVWSAAFSKQKGYAYRMSYANNIYGTVSSIFGTIISIAFYYVFITAIKTEKIKDMSAGQFLAFLASFSAFQGSLLNFASSIMQSVNIIPLFKRTKPILEQEPEIVTSKPLARPLNGNIEINHLNYRYAKDAPLVLNDVSIKIIPKEFVAIVGSSGSGKSTLLKLLLGFDKPESGAIYYDNQDINSYDVGSVRRQMGVVLQNGTLMQGTVFSNIVGSSALSMDDAWHAAEMAGFADDIRAMPMGMYTMVPAGGFTLSGGQRQRLMIARAVVKRLAVLFLDEATSALDNQTQAVVSRSLESLNITRVIIAHRLSTIIHADNIYVLDGGKIKESGNYEDLMQKNGIFAALAKRQQV